MEEENNVNIIKETQDAETPAAKLVGEADAGKEAKPPGLISSFFFYILPFLVNAVITCGLIWGYDNYLAQKIVAVDIKGFISQQRELYVTGKIDSEQFQRNVDHMETIVTAAKPNQVVLMGDAVVRNATILDIFSKSQEKTTRISQ